MSNPAYTRLEHFYCQVETTFGQIPNTGGTATLANGNFCRHIKFAPKPNTKVIERPDKTGSRGRPSGRAGRKDATWSLEWSAAMNGVAGVAPDSDPLFQIAMGQAGAAMTAGTTGTVSAATSATPVVASIANTLSAGDVVNVLNSSSQYVGTFLVGATGLTSGAVPLVGSVAAQSAAINGGTISRLGYRYKLSDSTLSGSLWSFRQPSTIDQRVVSGAVCQEYQAKIGADVATLSAQGEGLWCLSSNQFSVADATQKSGLTAFPTEPVAPVSNGDFITGFTGLIAVGNQVLPTIQSADIRAGFKNQLVKDTFGTFYPTGTEGDVRDCGISLKMYEDDSAAYAAVIALAQARTPVTILLVMGTTPGSILVHVLNNVQLTPPDSEEAIRYISSFPESMAHETALGSHDELVIWAC